MATRTISTPLNSEAVAVAYNLMHTRMAVCDAGNRVSVWDREPDSRKWAASASWAVEGGRLAQLCWAAPENGSVLCGGGANGTVWVWEQRPAGGDAGGEPRWRLQATLAESSHGVQGMAFAPRELGPLLMVAYADGFLRFFQASAVLAAEGWDPSSEFRATTDGGSAATAAAWRPSGGEGGGGVPPMVVAGTAGEGAGVWMFRPSLLRWERAAALGSRREDYAGAPVADVAWAPTLGRPFELLAVAAGRRVVLWSLRGGADAPEVERVAVLEHADAVWSVEWNTAGTWLAASTDGGEVCMWRPDLTGEWLLLNKIVGQPGDGAGGAAAPMLA